MDRLRECVRSYLCCIGPKRECVRSYWCCFGPFTGMCPLVLVLHWTVYGNVSALAWLGHAAPAEPGRRGVCAGRSAGARALARGPPRHGPARAALRRPAPLAPAPRAVCRGDVPGRGGESRPGRETHERRTLCTPCLHLRNSERETHERRNERRRVCTLCTQCKISNERRRFLIEIVL